MVTLKLPTFPPNSVLQYYKREKKIKAVCARITTTVLQPQPLILIRFIDFRLASAPLLRLLFFKPGWSICSRSFQLDVELFKCLFKLLLIPSKVRCNGIVEQNELIVQHLNLQARTEIGSDEQADANNVTHPL